MCEQEWNDDLWDDIAELGNITKSWLKNSPERAIYQKAIFEIREDFAEEYFGTTKGSKYRDDKFYKRVLLNTGCAFPKSNRLTGLTVDELNPRYYEGRQSVFKAGGGDEDVLKYSNILHFWFHIHAHKMRKETDETEFAN